MRHEQLQDRFFVRNGLDRRSSMEDPAPRPDLGSASEKPPRRLRHFHDQRARSGRSHHATSIEPRWAWREACGSYGNLSLQS